MSSVFPDSRPQPPEPGTRRSAGRYGSSAALVMKRRRPAGSLARQALKGLAWSLAIALCLGVYLISWLPYLT